MEFTTDIECALALDAADPLRHIRELFLLPPTRVSTSKVEAFLGGTNPGWREGEDDGKQVYFLGNSLGLQPKITRVHIDRVLEQWANYGVEGFFHGKDPWMNYHDQLIQPLSKIVGALPHEVSVMNQLTVNLHLMLASFYMPSGKKRKILCEQKAFPSDQYTFETYVKHLGMEPEEVILEIAPRVGEVIIRLEDIIDTIEQHHDEIALVFWGGINYYTGQLFDMASITAAAHTHGIRVGFDLAHAAGNVELKLHDWDVDFACWCSYKYLNSGPGAVGGVYIHERFHQDRALNRLAGWWGYDKATRFQMKKGFKPMPSAEGWQLSTPSMILYACHAAALEVFEEAGWDNVLEKQRKLNAYLWYLLNELNNAQPEQVIQVLTPAQERGSQVSLFMLKDGKKIFDSLMEQGIIVDWREPNVIRLAPVPLYNTFADVWKFYKAIKKMI
jgi:kynureninase